MELSTEGVLSHSKQVPPTSARTSNQQCDRLDFDNDEGGKSSSSFPVSDNNDSDGELEEGEIESEVDANDYDSKPPEKARGNSKQVETSKKQIPNFNIVKYNNDREKESASSLFDDSSPEKYKTESSDIFTIGTTEKSDTEYSDDGEIYSASEDNVVSSEKENSLDLYDMVFDFQNKNDPDKSMAESSLDDTLTEKETDNEKKRKFLSDEQGFDGAMINGEQDCPVAKKSKISTDYEENKSSTADLQNGDENAHEFDVIDETGDDGGENQDPDLELEDYEFDSEEELDDTEVYAWLEAGVNKDSVKGGEEDEGPQQREKLVLKEKGSDPFEMLPEGWVLVTHNSGMPVYLHKQSRVVTFSKPYFLGPGSVRKHDIPLSAIPCLYYRKEIEREEREKARSENAAPSEAATCNGDGNTEAGTTNSHLPGQASITKETQQPPKDFFMCAQEPTQANLANLPVKIEYAEEREKQNSLDADSLREYCEKLFEFRKITVNKFKTWKDRRRHLNTIKKQSRPALPSNTKLITCKVPTDKGEHKPRRKEFVLNPTGKSYVCILHEYAQHTLRVQPRYVFRELANAQNPYSATIVINEIEYGTGYASSKKAAKMEAAKATLSILIPEMSKLIEKHVEEDEDLSFFDDIKIEDPRVYELCNKSGQPSPYQILLECLKRNYGLGDTQCKIEVKNLKHQKSEYSLTVGKHSVTVVCKNKREGKQSAAQAMLQQLHPHIFSLGALLRLYGRSSWKSVKEKKKEEHAITGLQSQVRAKKPNKQLLKKLKEEMMKIQKQRESIKSKGKFRVDPKALPGTVTCIDL